jgi:hypothetical protein
MIKYEKSEEEKKNYFQASSMLSVVVAPRTIILNVHTLVSIGQPVVGGTGLHRKNQLL